MTVKCTLRTCRSKTSENITHVICNQVVNYPNMYLLLGGTQTQCLVVILFIWELITPCGCLLLVLPHDWLSLLVMARGVGSKGWVSGLTKFLTHWDVKSNRLTVYLFLFSNLHFFIVIIFNISSVCLFISLTLCVHLTWSSSFVFL